MASGSAIETSVPDDEELDSLELEQTEQPDAEQLAIEARARKLGWHPFAEYRGPPGKWVDAASFIERGETILPIVRAQNHRLEEQVARQGKVIDDLNRSYQEQGVVLSEMRELARKADERGYQRALSEAKAERDAAVEAGDKVAFRQAAEKIDALQETRAAETKVAPPPVPPRTQQPQVDPAVVAFVDKNPWFKTDSFLSMQMVAEHVKVIRRNPNMSLADQLDLAADNLREEYPEMFNEDPPVRQPPQRRAASVAAPTNSAPQQRRTATGIDSIADPEERKQARDAFTRQKRHMPDYTEAEYMAVYNDPRADVISIRKSAKEKASARA